MCGRYYIDAEDPVFQRLASQVTGPAPGLKTGGEIFPTDTVPVQVGPDRFRAMRWGFTAYGDRLVINARSETAPIKPMFAKAMRENRCLIPASGYYEWQNLDGRKIRYRFFSPGEPLFLAACYRQESGRPIASFVILTRPAATDFAFVHDRMPVIIPRDRITDWLLSGPGALEAPFTAGSSNVFVGQG